MFCSNCGTKLDDSALFCGECGTKVEAVVAAAVEETKATVEAAVAEGAATVEEAKKEAEATVEAVKAEAAPVTEPVKQEEAPAPEKKKGGKGKIVALVSVLALLLAGGGVAAWYFTGDDYNSQKNLKLAEEAFAAGELEDAKDYYETVLDYDETQKDVYIKLADIDMQEGKYESAIKTLQKGIKNTEDVEGAKDELTAKLEAAYVASIDELLKAESYVDALDLTDSAIEELDSATLKQKRREVYHILIDNDLAREDYASALIMANQAMVVTGDKAFENKKVDIYITQAQGEMAKGNYEYALGILETGMYESDSQKLIDERVVLFKSWIDSFLEAGNYSRALQAADDGYYETKDEVFEVSKVSIYRAWAEDYIAKSDYNNALTVLKDGVDETNSSELESMIEEINAAEMMLAKRVTDVQSGDSIVYGYNAKGQETSIQYLDADDNLLEIRTYEYDEEGNVAKFKIYEGDGTFKSGVDYTWVEVDGKKQCVIENYDSEGRVLIQEIVDEEYKTLSYTEYNVEDGSAIVLKQYEYDEAGNLLTEMIVTDEETITNQNEYIYDDAGNMIESTSLDAEGNPIIRNTYDEKGNLIESIEYDANGEVVSTEQSTYDENGNQLTYVIVSDEYNYHNTYTYDTAGNMIQFLHIDDKTGDETAIVYSTVKDGNVVINENVYYFNGEETTYDKWVSEYNEDGKLLKAECFDKDGGLMGAKVYEYDEKGNEIYVFTIVDGETEEYSIGYHYGFPEE